MAFVAANLPDALDAWLKRASKKHMVSKSALLRQLILEAKHREEAKRKAGVSLP